MSKIPQDPIICLSFINTKLRDYYSDLDMLCRELEIDKENLIEKLESVGYSYRKEENQFR